MEAVLDERNKVYGEVAALLTDMCVVTRPCSDCQWNEGNGQCRAVRVRDMLHRLLFGR